MEHVSSFRTCLSADHRRRKFPMIEPGTIRVAVNGYGVIGKRVAAAVRMQDDMELVGVADIGADWRLRVATHLGMKLFGATTEHVKLMEGAGLPIAGDLAALIGLADVIVDCTPKAVGAANAEIYRQAGKPFIVQGGEKHSVTGHSFVAESSYATALRCGSTRVVSCNALDRPHPYSAQKCRAAHQGTRNITASRDRSLGKRPWRHHEHARAGT